VKGHTAHISDLAMRAEDLSKRGMYMRLAFAVAAHLEPEILLVDEVLAVGATAFQRHIDLMSKS
jgi:ABC-type polysaccharide/polyol phosphate transport system ATPase subunit